MSYGGERMPSMYSQKRQFGNLGEQAVAHHLKKKGFELIEQNYLRKWGEIDLIVRKEGKVHFIEVKTVSREKGGGDGGGISRGTWRPEENVHEHKLKKLHRAIETWLLDTGWEGEWQIDIAAVTLDPDLKTGTVKFIEDIV